MEQMISFVLFVLIWIQYTFYVDSSNSNDNTRIQIIEYTKVHHDFSSKTNNKNVIKFDSYCRKDKMSPPSSLLVGRKNVMDPFMTTSKNKRIGRRSSNIFESLKRIKKDKTMMMIHKNHHSKRNSISFISSSTQIDKPTHLDHNRKLGIVVQKRSGRYKLYHPFVMMSTNNDSKNQEETKNNQFVVKSTRKQSGNTATTQEQRKKTSNRKSNSKTSKAKGNSNIQSENNNKSRITSKSSSSSSSDILQTWRIFGLEVHPNDVDNKIELSFNRQRRSKSSSSSNKRTLLEINDDESDEQQQQKDHQLYYLNDALLRALYRRLKIKDDDTILNNNTSNNTNTITTTNQGTNFNHTSSALLDVRVVRRSIDARLNQLRSDGRRGPRYVYVIDIDVHYQSVIRRILKNQPGRMELLIHDNNNVEDNNDNNGTTYNNRDNNINNITQITQKKKVIIVGSGPAGLFCAYQLIQNSNNTNIQPILIERGQSVEYRGKDIGTLINRKLLNNESNFVYGEGGAGTWSDGKLTTRIGRNSDTVRHVLETLVQFGAPYHILYDGSPHLGTDNLVRLLRNLRMYLLENGCEIHFNTKVTNILIENNITKGVEYVINQNNHNQLLRMNRSSDVSTIPDNMNKEGGIIYGDAVVLATGHSARDIYENLYHNSISNKNNNLQNLLQPKGFAVGFRIEHPQKVINHIQYGSEWSSYVKTGKQITDNANQLYINEIKQQQQNLNLNQQNQHYDSSVINTISTEMNHISNHDGILPVPSYRLATDQVNNRSVYSFCMCPGGQIVLSSTDTSEICINGMSFSQRDSIWANSALVVSISLNDTILQPYIKQYGTIMAGLEFQRDIERRAAVYGGGNFTVPVQRVTDFLNDEMSIEPLPSSSYRLGIKSAPLHTIYPKPIINAIKYALIEIFNKTLMPGYICNDALLHGVETRTSSPIRIVRNDNTYEAIGVHGLYPTGEGAGYAGGIVSAAVDGIMVSSALINNLNNDHRNNDQIQQTNNNKQAQKNRIDTFY